MEPTRYQFTQELGNQVWGHTAQSDLSGIKYFTGLCALINFAIKGKPTGVHRVC